MRNIIELHMLHGTDCVLSRNKEVLGQKYAEMEHGMYCKIGMGHSSEKRQLVG